MRERIIETYKNGVYEHHVIKCPNCGHRYLESDNFNFCPNCGKQHRQKEDTISRQVVLDKIKEVCFSKEKKWVDFRASYGSHGQRDLIIEFIKSLPNESEAQDDM